LETLNVGRLALPIAPLLLFGAAAVGMMVASWHGRRGACNVEPLLLATMGAGLVAGRLGFVLEYLHQYLGEPWRMLDIRDRGFAPGAAVVGACMMSAWFLWRRKPARKPLLHSAVAAACFWGAGTLAASAGEGGMERAPLPDLVLPSLEGTLVRTGEFKGKPIVINLWATWCPPCRRELPVLRDAQAHCRDVTFVFADQGEAADTVRAYLASQSLVLDNVLLDSGFGMSRQAQAQAFPTTLFFNAQGRLIERHMGELSPATLQRQLENLGACMATKTAARTSDKF
jgi:thiol-disulfide isomerase/thioredoxin